MTDDLGREPIPGVAGASGCPHPTQLPISIRWRNRGRARQVDGAPAVPNHPLPVKRRAPPSYGAASVGELHHPLQVLSNSPNEGRRQEKLSPLSGCLDIRAFDVIEISALNAYQFGQALPFRRVYHTDIIEVRVARL